jgi:hypothetical protein
MIRVMLVAAAGIVMSGCIIGDPLEDHSVRNRCSQPIRVEISSLLDDLRLDDIADAALVAPGELSYVVSTVDDPETIFVAVAADGSNDVQVFDVPLDSRLVDENGDFIVVVSGSMCP